MQFTEAEFCFGSCANMTFFVSSGKGLSLDITFINEANTSTYTYRVNFCNAVCGIAGFMQRRRAWQAAIS